MTRKKTTAERKTAELALSGEITIQRIAEVKTQLCEILAESDELVLDLKDVNRADLTFLQLLCSAHRTAQFAGKSVHCHAISDAVDQAISDAGFVRDNMGCGQECTDSCLWSEEG